MPPVTEDLFKDAYHFFVGAFGQTATQEAQLDSNSNFLQLGGGTCVDDPTWGNVKAEEFVGAEGNAFAKVEWHKHNVAQLEGMCHMYCFGQAGATPCIARTAKPCHAPWTDPCSPADCTCISL